MTSATFSPRVTYSYDFDNGILAVHDDGAFMAITATMLLKSTLSPLGLIPVNDFYHLRSEEVIHYFQFRDNKVLTMLKILLE